MCAGFHEEMAMPDRSVEGSTDSSLGERKLGTIHAVGQSLAIGPIFSAGAVTATVAASAGYNTPLSVVLAFIGSMALAYVIVVYARRFAGAGAVYEYLGRGVTASFGAFSAAIYLLGLLMLGAGGVYIGIGFLTQGFFDVHLSTHIPFWIGGAVALVVVYLLNLYGVRVAVRGVLALAILSAIPFLILSVVIIAKGGADGNTLAVFDPGHTSWNAVLKGVLFAVTLFVGFEAAAAIAEETRSPHRAIPVAVLATVAVSGVFFLLVTYAGSIGFGEPALGAKNAWASSPSAFGDLAHQYVGSWLATIVDLVIILDAISLAIAFMVTASRIMFALARDGLIPRWAGATSSKFGTPVAANTAIAAWSVVLLVWGGVTHYGAGMGLPDAFAAFLVLNAAGSYLVELIYIFLALCALHLVWKSRQEGGLLWKIPTIIVGLATPILAYKGSLDPFPQYPLNRGVYFALGLIAISAIWWLSLRIRHPERIAGAARRAIAAAEITPLAAETGGAAVQDLA
jgi:amino acid transporter